MATTIKLKSSVVKDKVPAADDIQIGEVCVGAHSDSPMLVFKDNADNIVKIKPGSEGLWQEDGSDYIKPKADGVGLKIPGSVDGVESTIENGTIQTKIKDGNTQQLYRGTVGTEDVFSVSYDGKITAAVFDLESLTSLKDAPSS